MLETWQGLRQYARRGTGETVNTRVLPSRLRTGLLDVLSFSLCKQASGRMTMDSSVLAFPLVTFSLTVKQQRAVS